MKRSEENTKRILLQDRSAEADVFISQLESQLIPALIFLQNGVKDLLGEEIPKAFLLEIAAGNFEDLKARFWGSGAFADVEKFQDPAVRKEMRTTIETRFYDFCSSVLKMFSATVVRRPLNDKSILDIIDLDETGKPIIPDLFKESLRDQYRDYLTNPKHIKVYESQRAACEAIQRFWDHASAAGFTSRMLPNTIVLLAFFDCREDENGQVIFQPKELDYNFAAQRASQFEQ